MALWGPTYKYIVSPCIVYCKMHHVEQVNTVWQVDKIMTMQAGLLDRGLRSA